MPCIRIEATFEGADEHEVAKFEGDNNADGLSASGVGILIELDRDEFDPEFDEYVKGLEGNALPIEYFHVRRYTSSRYRLLASTLGVRSCLIGSSGNARSGSQQSYISHLAKDVLDSRRPNCRLTGMPPGSGEVLRLRCRFFRKPCPFR